jgi:hypothetical protein
VVLDGSVPLANAVRVSWPEALIQRCVVHKERNLFGYLRKADHPKTKRLLQRLRLAEGAQAGREALAALRSFLASRSAAATASLDEAAESLITLHLLNVPSSLNRPLLSTNAIENVMRNYRGADRLGHPLACRDRSDLPLPCCTSKRASALSMGTPIYLVGPEKGPTASPPKTDPGMPGRTTNEGGGVNGTKRSRGASGSSWRRH